MSDEREAQAQLCAGFGMTLADAATRYMKAHPEMRTRAIVSALVTLTVRAAREATDCESLVEVVRDYWVAAEGQDPRP